MKSKLFTLALAVLSICSGLSAQQVNGYSMEELKLTKEWDKKFPKSEKVNHRKVTFQNRFGITLAADLYEPDGIEGRCAAIAVAGPFGAVKE